MQEHLERDRRLDQNPQHFLQVLTVNRYAAGRSLTQNQRQLGRREQNLQAAAKEGQKVVSE